MVSEPGAAAGFQLNDPDPTAVLLAELAAGTLDRDLVVERELDLDLCPMWARIGDLDLEAAAGPVLILVLDLLDHPLRGSNVRALADIDFDILPDGGVGKTGLPDQHPPAPGLLEDRQAAGREREAQLLLRLVLRPHQDRGLARLEVAPIELYGDGIEALERDAFPPKQCDLLLRVG